jgi:hypothetical protein
MLSPSVALGHDHRRAPDPAMELVGGDVMGDHGKPSQHCALDPLTGYIVDHDEGRLVHEQTAETNPQNRKFIPT